MKLLNFKEAIKDFENAYRYNNNYYKAIINTSKCFLQLFEPNNALYKLKKITLKKEDPLYEQYIKEVKKCIFILFHCLFTLNKHIILNYVIINNLFLI